MTYISMEVDIDLDDFVSSLTTYDMKKLIEILQEEGHLEKIESKPEDIKSAVELEFEEAINKLRDNYYRLSNDEIDHIISLSKKQIII